jgi:hypothetical protein
MERGYLIAVLAILATFTGLSRGFHAAEQWSLIHVRHVGALAKSECHSNAATRAIAKVQTRLRPHYAEEAQLLAEMNVPVPPMPAVSPNVPDEELASQQVAISSCARARALQQAERARHDMLRMQHDIERMSRQMRVEPIAVHVRFPADFEQRIQQRTQVAARIAADQIKLQLRTHCPKADTAEDSEQ